jgi:photosystem II stability/assembly factor-like uncharacterized protein
LSLLFLIAVGLPACSERDVTKDTGGPVWPDAFLESSVGDAAVDLEGVDAPVVPDSATTDGDALPPVSWTQVSISPAVNEDLHAVACLKSGDVYIAGNGGTVLFRAKGGTGFTKQNVQTQSDLYTVSIAESPMLYGVVAGKDFQIWETRGPSIQPPKSCQSDADCLDYSTCTKDVCDPNTLTCDNTWPPGCWSVAPQCSAYIFDTFYALHLFGVDKGFGAGIAINNAGGGTKYFSGLSWVCTAPTYPGEIFYDVYRLGDFGWVAGDTKGKIYRTEDMGTTWSPVNAGTTEVLRGIHVPAPGLGVAVGEKGTIVRSTDGAGKVWSTVPSGVTADLWDVFFLDASTGWAVGGAGTMISTIDGGKSWQARSSGTSVRLEAICFTSATKGWAVGEQGTVLTTVGGL